MSRLVLAENKNQPSKAKSFKFGELNFRGMHFVATWVRGCIIAACLLFVVRDLTRKLCPSLPLREGKVKGRGTGGKSKFETRFSRFRDGPLDDDFSS